MELQTLPRLAQAGRFGRGLTYSRQNISRVIAFARSRGVQVMLEIDTPGHCQVLERAYPELGLVTECPGTTCWKPLDVSKPAALQTVTKIFNELVPQFPNARVFIGGDECHTTCWAANAGVQAWAKSMNLSIGHSTESVGGQGSVFGWWINKIVDVVGALGKKPAMWSPLAWDPSSPPKNLIDAKALLNLWTGNLQELAYNITQSNEVVLSAGWYLPASTAYNVDPQSKLCPNSTCSAAQQRRIIGGEVQLSQHLAYLIVFCAFPRAADFLADRPANGARAWTRPTSFLLCGPT
jgi:N-acetyl-beta-hexosaminidase